MRRKLLVSLVGILVLAYGGLLAVLLTDTKPALGLDLQGGISITQRPKGQEGVDWNTDSLDVAVEKIRERVDSLGVAEPEILRQGDTIVVNLPGVKNQQQAEDLVKVTGKVYLRPVIAACQVLPDPNAPTATSVPTSDSTGSTGSTPVTSAPSTSGPTTTASGGPGRPGHDTTTTSTTVPATTVPPTTTPTSDGSTTTTTTPDVAVDAWGLPVQGDPNSSEYRRLKGNPAQVCGVGPQQGTGKVFTNASARVINGAWGVTVDLRSGSQGADIWNALAAECFDKQTTCPTGQLAIELDGELQSAPTVNARVFNNGVEITGSFTESEAKNLARVLNSGSLPVELKVESVQNVSPTLGKDSLRAAWISGLVGIGLVLLFMAFYYRTLGLIVAAGITVSGSLLWSIISLLSRTQGLALSLSGIAGIIVSVGVTVDSYVVFFERLKDEVRAGKTLRNSAQRGFTAAWRTIVIADLVSLIGAFVLWYLTVGSVRGFAFFLGLSTACDLFVAYFFTRPVVLLLARTQWMERRKVMGIEVATTGGAS
jgi:preprotein translocase subunit SecD